MTELYNYKLWNPNLSQFVAQPDRKTAEHIHGLGGVIILDGGHPMSCGRPERDELLVQLFESPVHELTVT